MPPTRAPRAKPIRNPRTVAGVTPQAALAAGIPAGPTELSDDVLDDERYGPVIEDETELYAVPESFVSPDGVFNPDVITADVGAMIDDAMDIAEPEPPQQSTPKTTVARAQKAEKREPPLID